MSEEMRPLTRKILESGLIDVATATLMERWGALPEGAAALAADKTIETATRAQLVRMADEIGEEAEKALKLRESLLDLDKIKWPVHLSIYKPTSRVGLEFSSADILLGDRVETNITAVIDRAGRYYFRPSDIQSNSLIPGYVIVREHRQGFFETILEVTELFVGSDVAAIQVSTNRE
jgi:hypothetical protein